MLRALRGVPIVSADVVEVSPAYDHAEMTSIAASHLAYELISLMAPAADQRVSARLLTRRAGQRIDDF